VDIAEIIEWLEESKDDADVKAAIGGLFDTALLKSEFDRRASKAVETYKTGHPADEDAAARLAELEGEIVAAEERRTAEAERADLRFRSYRLCVERQLPHDLVDAAHLENWEAVVGFTDRLQRTLSDREQESREAILATGGKPGAGTPPPAEPSADAIRAMSHRDRTKLIRRIGSERAAQIMGGAS